MGRLRVGKQVIQTTSEDRVVFPRDGITKGDVIDYYRRIAPFMTPHLKGRRLTMQRFTGTIDGGSFFQKDISDYFPDWVGRVTVPKSGGTVTHMVCNDAATLVYLANQNCLTPHVSLARLPDLDHPDQLIIDLDPAEDDFESVRSVAWTAKEVLDQLRLESFIKVTGSRGLHIMIPAGRKLSFDEARAAARGIAGEIVRRRPGETTLEQLKAKRRGRLFIDTNRIGTAQTAVAAFAIRACDGAPVAMPVRWEDLNGLNARSFDIRTAFDYLDKHGDVWRGSSRKAKSLSAAVARLAA